MERRSRTSGYAERRQVELMQRNTSKPRTASKRPTPRAVSPPTRLGERLSTVVPAKAGEKLSVVEKNIAELDPVQAHQVKTKILFISGNMLSTLQGLQQFTNLRTLSAASNYLTSFEALAALSDLTKLEVLNLQNNPVTQLPYYRLRMVSMCPRLTSLDNKEVGSRERTTASEVLRKEDEMLSTMYCQHTLIVKMSSVLSKMRLHEEFRAILESRGGPRQQPSKVSLDLFLISGAELSVWYMPPEDIVPVLRKQVRRVRLVKMAANNSDKDVDSVHGWDAAYRQVADEQKSFTTSLLSELQQAMSRLYGTPLKDAGDAMVLTAFKELVAALTTKHIKNDLLEDWKYRSSSAVTSPTSLPPQQADPGTPNDHELLLSARERQAKAEELHKNRLAKTRARDIPSQPPTFMQTAHKVSPRSMSISSQSRQRVEEIEGTDSLSPHSMSLMDPQEASEGGVTQEDLAQHIQDEVKLQQVNTALRLKLEEFQRVNAKNASTAKHYKSQLQEALKREASLREELDEMMEVHSEEVAALKHALIQLEENKAQSEASVMAQIENMRVHEVRLEELERAHETITTLQRDCDYLRQKVTQYRDEVRQRSVQREEVQQVESCPEEAIIMGNRCLMRRVFGRLVSATMPLAAKRNACYLLKDVSCMASVRTVMVQWKYLARKDAFVEKGHSRMVRSVREHYFRKWFEATCKRVLSGKRRQMDTAWNHWVMRTHQRQLSRSTGSGSSTPVARETTPAPTPLPSPARMPPGLRRQKPVRQEEDSDSDHIDPAGRVYNPVEGHTRVVLRKGLTTKIRKGRGVDLHQADRFEGNSEGDGDYITPPIKGKRSQQDLLAQQEMFRRWQMYCRGQKKKGRSITAMRHYTSQLKANTFTEWRQASKRQIAERRSIVSDFFSAWRKESHMSKQRCLNRRMADGMRRVHDTRLVEGMMVHWIRKTRHRLLLHRLEDYAAEKFKKDRLRAALGRWKAASIKRMIQLRHQKEQLEAEVQAHKDKVTTLGLSNIKLVDELSEAMNKAVDLEVDLEARSSELRDMTTSLASCQASKGPLPASCLVCRTSARSVTSS
eukprot:TRINITY_DN10177_c0_g1_i7.p1 TRINITY_DN10177_c0_g1~~TRINITY_DN10177_c0_g1_i7.p1  ORF type:complete len:1069 (+),score=371.09 TRINITY_DN10177_c0_g1_i7:1002-4208(+)